MSTAPRTRLLSLVATLTLCAAASTQAAESVEFKQVHKAGEKTESMALMNINAKLNVSQQGQTMPEMKQTVTQTRVVTQVIDSVDAKGHPTKVTFTFGEESMDAMENPMQGQQKKPFELAGKSITVTKKGDADPKLSQSVAAETEKEVLELFKDDTSMLPDKPVSIGDTWKLSTEEMQDFVPPGADMDAEGTGKLISIKTVDGRKVAEIEMKMKITGKTDAGEMTFDMKGTSEIDVMSSRAMSTKVTGPMKTQSTEQTPNGPVDVAMDGMLSIQRKTKLVSAGTGGGDAAEPDTDDAQATDGGDMTADDGADTATETSAPKMNGTFKNDKLSLMLTPGAGGMTGTIEMGSKKFAVKQATVDGDEVKGSFTAGADEFPFTATLDGDTMTFKTGSKTYELKRAGGGAANPLDQ